MIQYLEYTTYSNLTYNTRYSTYNTYSYLLKIHVTVVPTQTVSIAGKIKILNA